MPTRSPKRPTDANQLAKLIVDIATGQAEDQELPQPRNAAAVELGRLGGQKGGAARAKTLSAEVRKEIAQKAAASRWKRDS
jgi:hypothetical protein